MTADHLTVLQVSPADVGGGAEKVAYDLHRQYRDRDLDSWLAVHCRTLSDERIIQITRDTGSAWKRGLLEIADLAAHRSDSRGARWLFDRALRALADPAHMARIQRGLEDFDFPETSRLLSLPPRTPDALHLHNLHGGYFDIRAIPQLAQRVPTILTMHDVWPLTGHCAYPLTCERWRIGCGDCPDLSIPIPIRRDASALNHRIKKGALSSGARLNVATPSRWLMGLAEESGLVDSIAETRVIPNGVDTDIFSPGDRAEARAALGLPQNATIVLFSARSAKSSPFKGFEVLEEALPLIARAGAVPDLLLVALGEDAPAAEIEGVPIRFVPFAKDAATVALYYQAADLYLHPAVAENFPLAVLEAMSCGLPVVASDAGGIPEIVVDGVTGRLFPNRDALALAKATVAVLGDASMRTRMASAGRDRVLCDYTLGDQVDSYLEWYGELRSRRASSPACGPS